MRESTTNHGSHRWRERSGCRYGLISYIRSDGSFWLSCFSSHSLLQPCMKPSYHYFPGCLVLLELHDLFLINICWKGWQLPKLQLQRTAVEWESHIHILFGLLAHRQARGGFTISSVTQKSIRERDLDAINSFDGGIRAVKGPNGTAGIFSTYPQPYMTPLGTIIDQVSPTLLIFLVV